jgi:hypothetical protein
MVNVSYIMLDCSKAFYAFGSGTIIPGPDLTWPESSKTDRTRSTTLPGTNISCFLLGFSAASVGQSNTLIASNTTSQIPSGQELSKRNISSCEL